MKIHADVKKLMQIFHYTERDLAILLDERENKISEELTPKQILKLAALFHCKICDFTCFDLADNFLDYMCKKESDRKKLLNENKAYFRILRKYPDYAEYPSAPSVKSDNK